MAKVGHLIEKFTRLVAAFDPTRYFHHALLPVSHLVLVFKLLGAVITVEN